MVQAKGVLPTKGDDREVLYMSPQTCGYFIGVGLAAGPSTDQVREWLDTASTAVDTLVAREEPTAEHPQGKKVASVAVGFAPRFFEKLNSPAPVLELPVGFRPDLMPANGWFPGVQLLDVDAMFYVASVHETRVNEFLSSIASAPLVEAVGLERGYQTSDETEPFGYKDGERNVRRSDRTRVVYVHTDGEQPDEPRWADGATYMATMKINQSPEAFRSLPDESARDAAIGRTKDGTRLDLQGQGIHAHDEPNTVPEALPANSHVRKAGPRGVHDDTEIFRRGLPFMEVINGSLVVGLQFCSFQANPAQFDTVFNDWMMNHHFPPLSDGSVAGLDALMAGNGPGGSFTQISHAGMFFVPPYHEDGLVAALSSSSSRQRTHGRLVVSKTVVDPADPSKRFERGGFLFRVQEQDGTVVAESEFTTNSTGRGVCPVELEIGKTYTLVEVLTPHETTDNLSQTTIVMQKPNEHVRVPNHLAGPGGYGSR